MDKPKNQEVDYVFNPLRDDFTVTYDINEDRHPLPFTAKALEITKFPKAVADHVKKHLVDQVLNIRGVPTHNWELERSQVMEEVSWKKK